MKDHPWGGSRGGWFAQGVGGADEPTVGRDVPVGDGDDGWVDDGDPVGDARGVGEAVDGGGLDVNGVAGVDDGLACRPVRAGRGDGARGGAEVVLAGETDLVAAVSGRTST